MISFEDIQLIPDDYFITNLPNTPIRLARYYACAAENVWNILCVHAVSVQH